MDITQGSVFTFTSVVEGQGFSFTIQAETREKASESLRRRLVAIVAELTDALNNKKANAAS
jgi:hypothetical protein